MIFHDGSKKCRGTKEPRPQTHFVDVVWKKSSVQHKIKQRKHQQINGFGERGPSPHIPHLEEGGGQSG